MKKIILLIGIIALLVIAGCDNTLYKPASEKCDEWCFSNDTIFMINGDYYLGYNNELCTNYCKRELK